MNAPNLAESVHGHFALNEVSLSRKARVRLCVPVRPLDEVMAKEKTRGEQSTISNEPVKPQSKNQCGYSNKEVRDS